MNNYPVFIGIVFVLTTLLTIFVFFKAARYSRFFLVIIFLWLMLQGAVSLAGFYTVTNTLPPRFLLLIFPALVVIALLFVMKSGRRFLDTLDLRMLTLLHIVRLPVELVLFGLFKEKLVPVLMTFEGWNFDILSGITAPIIFFIAFRHRVHWELLLIWNFICLLLLVNIVTIAVLSAPFPFQQLAFDQPNIAVLYFPFVWLPCCVVPLVLLSHLAAIRKLILIKGSGVAIT